MSDSISYGPCWCGGDATTGGHWHGSATGGNQPPTQENVFVLILEELRAIRSALGGTDE